MDISSFYKIYVKCLISYRRLYIFIILFIIIIIKAQQPYKSYILEGFNIFIIIYNDKISVHSYSNGILQTPKSTNLDTDEKQINSEDEGKMTSLGYIYTERFKIMYIIVKGYIYYGYDGVIINTINNNITKDIPSTLVAYQCKYRSKEGCQMCDFFICFIDKNKKLGIYEYTHGYGGKDPYTNNNKTIDLVDSSGMVSISKSDYVSCQIMTYDSKDVLVCFFENEKTEIGAITLNIETLEQDNNKQPKLKKNSGAKDIKSVLFNNNDKAFICYINDYNNIACIIFDLYRNEFDVEYKYIESMTQSQNYFNIDYFKSSSKFILSCYSSIHEFEYLILYDQMNIVDNNFNGGKYCSTNMTMEACTENNLPFISLFYDSDTLKMVKRCGYQGEFSYLDLPTSCNKASDRKELEINDNNEIETDFSFSNSDEVTDKISEINTMTHTSTINEMTDTTEISEISEMTEINTINEMTDTSKINEMTDINSINEMTDTSKINETTDIKSINEMTDTSKKNEMTEINTIKEMTEISTINEMTEISNINESEKVIIKNEIQTNKTLEVVINNINRLIEEVKFGEIYEIKGEDYLVKVCPINYNQFDTSSTNINFLQCEKTLRSKNQLSSNDYLTEVMIEIETKNINSLTNRVEYSVFYGNQELDLSVCEKDLIEINYNIPNSSLLNLEMISKYSDIGIDILNSKDKFFNDICYPYSENESDIILKDRLLYIYQNFSKCDDNCEYQKIETDKLIITCKCSIKKEMKYEHNEPRFDSILLDLITGSSFGVVKCYNLVFNSAKTDNIGFFIFLVLIVLHIPLIIHYYSKTIIPIKPL